jgi:hypothetical protein
MGQNPLNLALRFVLELGALAALGLWGWTRLDGLLRIVAVVGLPLIAATLWGIFRVPGDASSSGHAPVPVPGIVRLLFELALFALATWALYDAGYRTPAWILGIATVVHYLLSYDRVAWLLEQ